MSVKTNIRHVKLETLQKIKRNNYKSLVRDYQYEPETIDKEIERKINSKKYRGLNGARNT